MQSDSIVNPASIEEDHIHVAAAIVWDRQQPGRFLIAQRQKGKHLEDYWELPGGKLESGESVWQALQREIAEEVGIQVIRGEPYMRVYHRYPERNILLDTWSIDEYRGEVEAREQQLVTWVDIEALDRFRFPPADIPILESIKRSVKAGIRRFP